MTLSSSERSALFSCSSEPLSASSCSTLNFSSCHPCWISSTEAAGLGAISAMPLPYYAWRRFWNENVANALSTFTLLLYQSGRLQHFCAYAQRDLDHCKCAGSSALLG